jgi:hypothetical protein
MQFPPKACQDTLCRSCVFHLVGSAGHIVSSGASGERNVDALLFMLGWDWYGFHKCALGPIMPNMCFCIWSDLRVT